MDFISVMEWIGTVAFAASGAFVAIEKKLDYYGICILAIVTAIGGGIVRDLLINRDLPASLENPLYVIISLVTAFLIIVFYEKTEKITNLVNIADAIGLAAFVAVGAEVAVYQSKGTLFVIITMAVLTGTGGGILREIFGTGNSRLFPQGSLCQCSDRRSCRVLGSVSADRNHHGCLCDLWGNTDHPVGIHA